MLLAVKTLNTAWTAQEILSSLLKGTRATWKEELDESNQTTIVVDGTKILVAYQPQVRSGDIPGLVYRLREQMSREKRPAYGVIAGDFLSDVSRERIRSAGLGSLDRNGNCSICFGRVLIEVRGNPNCFRVPKESRALFAPKAQRVLRALLSSPLRP